MRDHLDVGCAPTHEPCAQIGSADYWERARAECRAYIEQTPPHPRSRAGRCTAVGPIEPARLR